MARSGKKKRPKRGLTESDEPFINAHGAAGTLLWIDMMWVPPDQRGKGVGRRFYEKWESNLPKEFALIKLMTADTGSGPSDGFWLSMGYQPVYCEETGDYESDNMMWKGVNGHPTPSCVEPEYDDWEEEPEPNPAKVIACANELRGRLWTTRG